MTNEVNPNRGGPIHSHPDSESLRFPARGRTDPGGPDGYAERLRDQVENGKVHEMAISPDIKAGSVIEPSQELRQSLIWPGPKMWDDVAFRKDPEAWKKGLEFGGEE